jgi:tRNA-guanine family transglycosylase
MPMREARHGKIYISDGSVINIRNSPYMHDHTVIDANSPSPLSQKHLKSYLAYLFRAGERSSETIACTQNIAVTLMAMEKLRNTIGLK